MQKSSQFANQKYTQKAKEEKNMKSPRKVAIYKARGMGKLRRGGVVFHEDFISRVKTAPAKNRINKGEWK